MAAESICVYCSSSDAVDGAYFEAARALGAEISRRKLRLIYGGADVGLMGVVAEAARSGGGEVVGVIPEAIHALGIASKFDDELVVTPDMRSRKAVMEGRSDAFIALPGGFGTLEELLETITHRQLRYHNKPIILLNAAGFYDPLAALFESCSSTDSLSRSTARCTPSPRRRLKLWIWQWLRWKRLFPTNGSNTS